MNTFRVGGDYPAWCGPCRKMLDHRVIAMVAGDPVKGRCSQCRGEHKWRAEAPKPKKSKAQIAREKSAREEKKLAKEKDKLASKVARAAEALRKKVPLQARALAALADREHAGREASVLAGRLSMRNAVPYNPLGAFQVNDVLLHPQFGRGLVVSVVAKVAETVFPDKSGIQVKHLACAPKGKSTILTPAPIPASAPTSVPATVAA